MSSDLVGIKEIKLPVSIAPRKGKYYGTEVLDADGRLVADFWTPEGDPSIREKEYLGGDWTREGWSESCSDEHWESESSLRAAEWLVNLLNYAQHPAYIMVHGHKAVNRFSFRAPELLETKQPKTWAQISNYVPGTDAADHPVSQE